MKYIAQKNSPTPVSLISVYNQLKYDAALISELCKVKLSLAVALSAATGFLLSSGQWHEQIIAPVLGVFLLACGCCGLNQIQERKTDALMQRTCRRPLPSGRLAVPAALFIPIVLLVAGLAVLSIINTHNLYPTILGLLALLWYNGLYTYAKKVTAYSTLIGAPLGMIPPFIGWLAAGGSLSDGLIWMYGLFFFIWQIPHFWFLLLMQTTDYQKAQLPAMTDSLAPGRLFRLSLIWMLAAATAGIMLAWSSDMGWIYKAIMGLGSIWLIFRSLSMLLRPAFTPRRTLSRLYFITLNAYCFFVMAVICLNALRL
jgi:protoheme IX farnesyltransferase